MQQAEIDLTEQILHDGQSQGVFSLLDPTAAAEILTMSLRGLEPHLLVHRRDAAAFLSRFEQLLLDGLRPR